MKRRTGILLSGACCLLSIFVIAGCGEKENDHVHAWYGQVCEEAACEQDGWKEYKCDCGDVRKVELPALGHDMQPTDGVAATCEQAGFSAGEVCQRCGITTATEIPATGHIEEIVAGVAPGCVEDGLTEGKVCSVCDVVLQAQSVIAASGHTWEVIDVTTGGTLYQCQRCGEDRMENSTTHEHEFLEITEENLPSCATEGERISRCVCGETKTEILAAVGHKPSTVSGEMPTCTQDGATGGEWCDTCGEILTPPTVIPALGHSWDDGTAVENGTEFTCKTCGDSKIEKNEEHTHVFDEHGVSILPTCEEAGMEVWKCACGEAKTEILAAVGHKPSTVSGEMPTCTQDGATGGEWCDTCGEILTPPTVIPALGHSWDDGTAVENGTEFTCKTCGDSKIEKSEEHTHVFDEQGESVLPTCQENGLEIWKCACGEWKTNVLPALGHQVVIVTGKAPTCEETGLTDGEQCERCGEVLTNQTELPAVGHQAQTVEGKPATCQETGLTEGKICSVCHEVLVKQEEIPLAEHTINNGACAVCGFTAKEELPIATLEYMDKNGGWWVTGVKEGEVARKIVIPDTYEGKTVTGICDGAFTDCYTLNSVTIGANVTYFGLGSFASCYNLWEVYNFSKRNITIGEMPNDSYITLNAKHIYTKATDESNIAVQDGFIIYDANDERTLIGCMKQATELSVPEGVTQIQYNVFSECVGLTKVILSDTVKKIGSNTFAGCDSLQSVVIGKGVTRIERMAFESDTTLVEVEFKETSNWTITKNGMTTAVSAATLQDKTAAAIKVKENWNVEWRRN